MMCGVQQLCISPLAAQFTKKAANGSEKAFCVLTFHECGSITIVQRQFRTKFGKQPPSDNSIRRWYAQFQETGCVCERKSTGRPSMTEEQVEQVRQTFVLSLRKSAVKRQQRVRHTTANSVAHFTEEAKAETMLPNAATKITTRRSPSKDDFLH